MYKHVRNNVVFMGCWSAYTIHTGVKLINDNVVLIFCHQYHRCIMYTSGTVYIHMAMIVVLLLWEKCTTIIIVNIGTLL